MGKNPQVLMSSCLPQVLMSSSLPSTRFTCTFKDFLLQQEIPYSIAIAADANVNSHGVDKQQRQEEVDSNNSTLIHCTTAKVHCTTATFHHCTTAALHRCTFETLHHCTSVTNAILKTKYQFQILHGIR